MLNKFLPFTTTLIGSMPRSNELLQLKEDAKANKSSLNEYNKKVKEETAKIINIFERTDIDVIVSGELTRDNYMSYIAEKVDGVKLMTMEEIKSYLHSESTFNDSLDKMDAADNSMNNPICVDKINTNTPLNLEELELIKSLSDKEFKITIPSPYLLTRSMWFKEISGKAYRNRKELGKDVVELILNEIRRLIANGVKIIQIDEPILSEVVFTTEENNDPSFY